MASSGKYDQRVSVESFTTTRDKYKEKIKAWVEDRKLWADVDYGSAGERRVGAAQEQADNIVTVTVRQSTYSAQIKAQKHRLQFDGKIWDIESAVPGKNRNHEIIIVAKATE